MLPDCPLPEGALVIAYLRVSGEAQKERGTIVSQAEDLEHYIEAHGLRLARPPFVDEAKPGWSVAPRDAFQQMIAFTRLDPRLCDGVIFWSWSRFSRDQDDAHFYKADLRRRGYILISLSDGIPADTGMDYVMESLIHWKDQEYLTQLSLQTKRGLHLIAQKGYAPGGFPPRGYKREYEELDLGAGSKRRVARWVPDPEWAPVVRRAFELKASGATTKEILAETHVFNAVNSLTWLWRNRTYLGIRKCGEIEIAGAHQAIIDQELWDRVQARLRERPDRTAPWVPGRHPRQRASNYLLSGLLRCAECGSAMVGSQDALRSGNLFRFYICSQRKRTGIAGCPTGKLKAGLIEGAVMNCVSGRILTAGYAKELLEAVEAELDGSRETTRAEISRLSHRLSGINRSIYHLLDSVEQDGSKAARQRLLQREGEKAGIEAELRALHAQASATGLRMSDVALEDALKGLRDSLAAGDVEHRRGILRQFVVRIEAARDRANLVYVFPLPTGAIDTCPQGGWYLKAPLFSEELDLVR